MLVRSISLGVAAIVALATASAQEPQKPGARDTSAPTADTKSAPAVRFQKDPDGTTPPSTSHAVVEAKDSTREPTGVPVSKYALDPSLVFFDHPDDSQLWGGSIAYKMCFEKGGATFIPFFGADAPRNYEVSFAAPAVTVAGEPLAVRHEVAPSLTGTRVQFDRDGLVEVYDLSSTYAEQSFRFDALATRGAIELRIPIATDLETMTDGSGLVFRGPHGGVSYSHAIAVDADGRRIPLSTIADGASIEIRVPAEFVKSAKLPLVIDPLIGTTATVHSSSLALNHADVAYDASNDVYLAVWFRDWSATDSDVFAQRLDATLAPVGALITIDATGNAWEKPAVANKNIGDVFLAVAQVSTDKASPYWIAGRIVDAASGATGIQLDIAKEGVAGHFVGDKINPDVGGDPAASAPTYFTVVWERVYSATDHDIHLKQVETTGALRNPSPTYVANATTDNDSHPSISKSNGLPPYADQCWAVVWQRFYNGSDEDIYGSFVSWDGVLRTVATSTEFVVDTSSRNDVVPAVSSPTTSANGRIFLAAFQGGPSGGDTDIHVQPITLNGRLLSASPSLQTLENAGSAQTWPQSAPSVDGDGCRFVVGYHEPYLGSGSDLDVRLTLLGWEDVFSALVVNDARTAAGYSSEAEQFASVLADASAAPTVVRPHRYVVSWQNPNGTSNDTIEARRYDGYALAGGFATRTTGCGGATINASGSAILGEQANFNVTAPGSVGRVVLFGLPQSVDLAPLCSGCILGTDGPPYPVPLQIDIPCRPVLVGGTVSLQGVAIYGGGQPCLGDFALTDTVDLTLR